MKKLMLLGILCLSALLCKAQHSSIDITKSTGCTIYLELWGDVSGTTCSSAISYTTGLIAIPPGPTTTYDPVSIPNGMNCGGCAPPSLNPSDVFWYAIVYKSPSATPYTCTPGVTFKLEDNGCNINNSASYAAQTSMCMPCGGPDVTVVWTDMGTYIDLNIF